jgi:hypothetical protein
MGLAGPEAVSCPTNLPLAAVDAVPGFCYPLGRLRASIHVAGHI